MEQIQFIYFQYYMQYYTVHHKENSTYMEIWHRGWWFKLRPLLPVCFGFTIVAVTGELGWTGPKIQHAFFTYRKKGLSL